MMQERGEAATNPARKAHIQYGRSGYNKKTSRTPRFHPPRRDLGVLLSKALVGSRILQFA
jgi:hypothetical protein